MNRLRLCLSLLLSFCLLSACGPEEERQPVIPDAATLANAEYVPGEILVRFRAGTVGAAATSAADLFAGAVELERLRIGGYRQTTEAAAAATVTPAFEIQRLQLPPGLTVPAALEQLRTHPGLLYAGPNYIVHRTAIAPPSDPFFARQWGMNNTGQTLHGDWGSYTGTVGSDIGALDAWGVTTGDGSTVVALIDSGIDYNHPDLVGNLWRNPGETGLDGLGLDKTGNGVDDDGNGKIDDFRGWNFVANNNAPLDDDVDGHGSHVAGIVGARGNNAVGVAGINWQVQLLPLKFLDSGGGGTIANAIAAIDYAVANGARVINASYTYPQNCSFAAPDPFERDAIAAAGTAGVLFVAAAGNSSCDNDSTPFYPASHLLDNILAVAATDPNDGRASFSNTGVTSVDLGAPGLNVYSTVRTVLTGRDGQRGYDYLSGTSMAAPMVAGAAALLWNRYPTLGYWEIRDILLGTVDPVPSMVNTVSGGRLNLGRALTVDLALNAPAAPSGLVAPQLAGGAVTLLWVDNATTETAYVVERAGNGSFVPLVRLPADSTGYTDAVAPDGRAVRYRVKAIAGYRSSAYSNEVPVTVPLRPPSGLTTASDPNRGIQLYWNDDSGSEERYEVERRADSEAGFSFLANSISAIAYFDAGAAIGTVYHYRVRAFNTLSGYSAYSAEATGYRPPPGSGGGGGCFVATAAWGSPWTREVSTLRSFRDRVLLPTAPGRLFVASYYQVSPPLAAAIAEHAVLRTAVRWLLTPLVWLADQLLPAATAMDKVPPTPPQSTPPEDVVSGELLVKFHPATTPADSERLVRASGCTILERLPVGEGEVLRLGLPADLDVAAAQRHFCGLKEVLYAEPNRRVGLGLPGRPGR